MTVKVAYVFVTRSEATTLLINRRGPLIFGRLRARYLCARLRYLAHVKRVKRVKRSEAIASHAMGCRMFLCQTLSKKGRTCVVTRTENLLIEYTYSSQVRVNEGSLWSVRFSPCAIVFQIDNSEQFSFLNLFALQMRRLCNSFLSKINVR